MNETSDFVNLYNEKKEKFFKELYSHWESVPEKIVSDLYNYFPMTISFMVQRGIDISTFKRKVRDCLSSEIESLKASVEGMREERLHVLYHFPVRLPIKCTQKDINEKDYPEELGEYVKSSIKKITKLVLTHDDRVLADMLNKDIPKLKYHDVEKYIRIPDRCVSYLEEMKNIIVIISDLHRNKERREWEEALERARDAWEKA